MSLTDSISNLAASIANRFNEVGSPNEDFGSGNVVNTNYVGAIGFGIVANNTGLLGNNYNFAPYTFDSAISPGLPGSFTYSGYYGSIPLTDEFMSVNPNDFYRLTSYIYQQPKPGFESFPTKDSHLSYAGLAMYDIDKNLIEARDHMHKFGSYTQLTQPLSPGETEVHIQDASNWENVATPGYSRAFVIYEYKNSFGFKYDHYTRIRADNMWDIGGVDTGSNTINLNKPLPASFANPDHPSGTWPVGTRVANGLAGATYKYCFFGAFRPTESGVWYKMVNFIAGVDRSGLNVQNNFSPGTAFVKIFTLPNYSNRAGGWNGYPDTGDDHEVKFTGFDILPDPTGKAVSNTNGSVSLFRMDGAASNGASVTMKLATQESTAL